MTYGCGGAVDSTVILGVIELFSDVGWIFIFVLQDRQQKTIRNEARNNFKHFIFFSQRTEVFTLIIEIRKGYCPYKIVHFTVFVHKLGVYDQIPRHSVLPPIHELHLHISWLLYLVDHLQN